MFILCFMLLYTLSQFNELKYLIDLLVGISHNKPHHFPWLAARIQRSDIACLGAHSELRRRLLLGHHGKPMNEFVVNTWYSTRNMQWFKKQYEFGRKIMLFETWIHWISIFSNLSINIKQDYIGISCVCSRIDVIQSIIQHVRNYSLPTLSLY